MRHTQIEDIMLSSLHLDGGGGGAWEDQGFADISWCFFVFLEGGGGGRWEAEESRIQDITANPLLPTSAPTPPKIRCASDWNLWQGGKN